MSFKGWILIFTLGLGLAGCFEDKGDKAGSSTQQLNNSDFIVQVPHENETQSSSGQGAPSNSGSAPSGESVTPDPIVQTQPEGGIIINNGDQFTSSRSLALQFKSPFELGEMKVSENLNCSGGSWEGFVTEKTLQALQSGLVSYSVQYKDFDGPSSLCFKRQIIIDDVPPNIVFSKYPAQSVEEGSTVEIVYSVTDDLSSVSEVKCTFANLTKACVAGTGSVLFPTLQEGNYEFIIEAIDQLGNISERKISFQVSSLYKNLVRDLSVKQNNKVDILFVVDNSGSMEYEQRSMASRVRNFLDVVRGLDWQIAVTTTDPRNNVSWGDGQLLPFAELQNTFIISSKMDEAISRNALSKTLQRSEVGSGSEQGILTTYRALERAQSASINSDLIREGAQFAVVLISDEDESGNQFRNDPTNLINYINSTYLGQKSFSFHSIIARPGDRACLTTYGAREGVRFSLMAQMTGGVVGDVCATDYAQQMLGVAEGVRRTLKSVTLSCAPVVDQVRRVIVKKDGQVANNTFTIQGQNILFDEMLSSGNYSIEYSCTK